MSRSNWKRLLAVGLAVALLLFAVPQADACGRWGCGGWGGWGGYYGGWGGYYGGWGGCYGCGWSGYYAPYYAGCSSCCGGYSSCGCDYGGCSSYQPAAPASPTPATPPAPPKTTGISSDGGYLTVSVPSDAKVTINGMETRSTGSQRQFCSLGLEPGRRYPYVVRAQVVRNGQVQEDTRTAILTAGQSASLNFGFNAAPQQVATNP